MEQREGEANQFPNISEVMRSGRGEVGYEDDEVKNTRVDREGRDEKEEQDDAVNEWAEHLGVMKYLRLGTT